MPHQNICARWVIFILRPQPQATLLLLRIKAWETVRASCPLIYASSVIELKLYPHAQAEGNVQLILAFSVAHLVLVPSFFWWIHAQRPDLYLQHKGFPDLPIRT